MAADKSVLLFCQDIAMDEARTLIEEFVFFKKASDQGTGI